MVKVIDKHKERMEQLENYNKMYNLAEEIFGKNVRKKKGLWDIVINEGKDIPVRIIPNLDWVEVNKKSYYNGALNFAEKGEKITGREFKLEINYKH